MASSSIESAAHWLAKLLVEEVQYLAAVSDKVEELQSELEWMQCFLWDADEKQNKNALLRKWISDIKDLALEAEDLIELYILGVARKRETSGLLDYLKWSSCCCLDATRLHYVGAEIDALTAKIAKLSSRLQTYGVKSSYDKFSSRAVTYRKMVAEQRRTYSHVDDKDVVGLQDCVEDVVNKLKGSQRIVAIHGMGGIGKTTLAREVFNHTPLKDHFDGFAWAYISQQLQLGAVCREILFQLIPEKKKEERDLVQGLQESQLPGKLCEMLKRKNYLVVLDDVWFSRDWKCLEPCFPLTDTSHGSKLLVTTRNRQILSSLGDDVVSYYQVKVLDREKSWQLLQKKAHFNKENKGIIDQAMVELGDKMLHHCNGHPLAIVVLGGVLATKKSVEEWASIYDNLPSYLQGDESYNGVYEVLSMSYYELPYTMKPCFLHFGHFPEDFEIPVEKLYHLWITEGIVSSNQDNVSETKSLDDISEVYLIELVQKGMVQVGGRDSDQKIKTCRLHDLMRDQCLKINKEENFLQIFDYHACKIEQQHSFLNAPNEKLRRMAIYVHKKVNFPLPRPLDRVSPLRSLMFFPSEDIEEESCEWIITICKVFQLLRVLDFEGLRLQGRLPKEIGYLIYLRYLSLKDTRITELPSSIGKLRSLMIFDLRVSKVIIRLSNQLWKMKSLRHLYFPSRTLSQEVAHRQGYEIEDSKMLKLDQLSHLEKLEDVDLDRVDVNGLIELRSMRKLSASCVFKVESLKPFLKSTSIKSLSLKLHASIVNEDPLVLAGCSSLKVLHIDAERYPRTYLPKNFEMFPQNLVELGFWYCRFSEDPMPILEKLPKLRNLELHICYDGDELCCSNIGFPELTHLFIDGLFTLTNWIVEEGGLPKLQKVQIYNSPIRKLPNVLPSYVSIACNPCIRGIERHGSCPFFKG